MLFGGKLLNDLKEQDLEEIVLVKKLREHQRLEYTLEAYGRSDSQVEEMLSDISGMANSQGGNILIGVEEDQTTDDGIPVALIGIENADTEVNRMLSSCQSSLDPPIRGLEIGDVPLSNGKSAIVVRVPNSPIKPHMITSKQKNRFWTRLGRMRVRMTTDQIRQTFLDTREYLQRLDEFLDSRKQALLKLTEGKPWIYVSATPVLLSPDQVNVFDPSIKRIFADPPNPCEMSYRLHYDRTWATLWGVEAVRMGKDFERENLAQIHRTGHVEVAYPLKKFAENTDNPEYFTGMQIAALLVGTLEIARIVHETAGILDSVAVTLGFLNADGMYLRWWRGSSPEIFIRWSDSDLTIGPIVMPNLNSPNEVAKVLLTKVYNQ